MKIMNEISADSSGIVDASWSTMVSRWSMDRRCCGSPWIGYGRMTARLLPVGAFVFLFCERSNPTHSTPISGWRVRSAI